LHVDWAKIGVVAFFASIDAHNRTRLIVKRIHYLLFLVFYFASSYAVSQERTRIVVGEVQYSKSASDEVQVQDGRSQVRDTFPNYKQARPRMVSAVDMDLASQRELKPGLSEASLAGFSKSLLQSLYDGASFLSRAPPFES
jgi:hypothetical protein